MSKKIAERYIGIDYGAARIGLAYSDERAVIATTLALLKAERGVKATVASLLKMMEQHTAQLGYRIKAFVVGYPLMMSGKVGFIADEVDAFIAELEAQSQLPIVKLDERLSSLQADRALREFGLSRKRRSKHLDTVSAVIILQSYLDQQKLAASDGAD